MSQYLEARCPGCHQYARFTFNGNQHWPAEVARKLGLPAVIGLWTCSACHTTVSELTLKPGSQQATEPTPARSELTASDIPLPTPLRCERVVLPPRPCNL